MSWTPTSWRSLPIAQQPQYADEAALERVLSQIRQLPPLVFSGDDTDPFNRVREWWNGEPFELDRPLQHLSQTLGLGAKPTPGWHDVGAGHVFLGTTSPAAFGAAGAHADLARVVREAFAKAGVAELYRERAYALTRRGKYVVTMGMKEATGAPPPELPGKFINLFSDTLEFVTEIDIAPGRAGLWVDVERLGDSPSVAASASRIEGWEESEAAAAFTSHAPVGLKTVTWLRLPRRRLRRPSRRLRSDPRSSFAMVRLVTFSTLINLGLSRDRISPPKALRAMAPLRKEAAALASSR